MKIKDIHDNLERLRPKSIMEYILKGSALNRWVQEGINKKVINDFINGTPDWLTQMARLEQDKGCVICGIIPDNIKALVVAIKELKEKADKFDSLNK